MRKQIGYFVSGVSLVALLAHAPAVHADPLVDTQLYEFGSAPAAVPEPASVLLVGAGVVAGGRRLRKQAPNR